MVIETQMFESTNTKAFRMVRNKDKLPTDNLILILI